MTTQRHDERITNAQFDHCFSVAVCRTRILPLRTLGVLGGNYSFDLQSIALRCSAVTSHSRRNTLAPELVSGAILLQFNRQISKFSALANVTHAK